MFLDELFDLQLELVKTIDLSFKRYLYSQIDWDSRLIGIVGARGVGKTTLLLQYYKENFASPEECLYISADNIKVEGIGLFEIASSFFKVGGKLLIIDEIHKYPGWSKELKNIYDSFPKGKVVISGSSTLDIVKGKYDLSRRAVIYDLSGLSFREYLILETKSNFNPCSIDDIIEDHLSLSGKITKDIRVLKYFREYVRSGYYPFYLEGKNLYDAKLRNVIEKVVYEDIPSVFGVKPSSIPLLKKLILLVATSQPFVPNIERISSQLKISKEYVYNYLEHLEKAGIFAFLYPMKQGFKLARKPEKIYLENPNLFHAVLGKGGFRSEIGAIRESFFFNQLKVKHRIFEDADADFLVDNKYSFEVGGKGKSGKQLGKREESYVAADEIEVGAQNKIPLWLFGFLY